MISFFMGYFCINHSSKKKVFSFIMTHSTKERSQPDVPDQKILSQDVYLVFRWLLHDAIGIKSNNFTKNLRQQNVNTHILIIGFSRWLSKSNGLLFVCLIWTISFQIPGFFVIHLVFLTLFVEFDKFIYVIFKCNKFYVVHWNNRRLFTARYLLLHIFVE